MGINRGLTPDQVLDLHEHIAAAHATMDEGIQARLKELAQQKRELDERIAAVGSIKQIESLKAESERTLEAAREQARKTGLDIDNRRAELEAYARHLKEREAQVEDADRASSQLHSNRIAQAAEKMAQADARHRDLDKREAAIAEKEKHLDLLSAQLNDKAVELQRKADRLRSAASDL